MNNNLIAMRYAKPLLQIAINKNKLKDVYQDMKLFTTICLKEPLIKQVLENPILDSEKKKHIINKIFNNNSDQLTKSFINLLIKKRRESYICKISDSFLEIYNEYTNTKKVNLTIAHDINDDTLKIIEEKAKTIGHCENVKIIKKINPNIVGGYILKIDDKQIDLSFKSALKNIRENINNKSI
ncbi:MAG: ATP synthase F1 subunit delta [Bacteroidetes bacterium]|nr:ATP synthase F1 subunit delta [Bacteroidota bacterium]